ncbi:MAG: D-Ala-D-Ala carboxypeptidase family metallohydrolase [Cetobacterium sp.]
MITTDRYFGKQLVTPDIAVAAQDLLNKVNAFLEHWGREVQMTSGYRSPEYNKTIKGAAPNSNHMSGKAIDISDSDKALAKFCIIKKNLLADYGLWCEDPRTTPTWVHFQSIPPKSGNRFYIPSLTWATKLTGPLTLESL